MGQRIVRGKRSANGVTVLPARFLQALGLFWIMVIVGAVWVSPVPSLFAGFGVLLGLDLILVGRAIQRSKDIRQPEG